MATGLRCGGHRLCESVGMTERSGSTWSDLVREIEGAATGVRMLPLHGVSAQEVLDRLAVSEGSTMGALATHVGALLVDHGWLRVLGGGSEDVRGLAEANRLDGTAPPFLIVAEDVLGGSFALDGGGLGFAPGEVCYFGPDTLEWTGIGGGYSAFVSWALSGGLAEFYTELRWDGWEQESLDLALDEGIAIYPPPFSVEGQAIANCTRRPVPLTELHDFYSHAARSL